MADPSLPLQIAVVTALKADAALGALVGARVYDEPPGDPSPEFPYLTLGDGQVLGDDDVDGCEDRSEVFIRIDAWSRDVGYPEVKRIVSAVRQALRTADFVLDDFSVDVVEFVQCQYLRDSDGLTRHGALEFRFLVTHL